MVPAHLTYLLTEWANAQLTELSDSDAAIVAARMRIPLEDRYEPAGQLMAHARADEDVYLELVDHLLELRGQYARHRHQPGISNGEWLRRILIVAGSAWTVSDDGTRLEERVDEQTKHAYTSAATPKDAITDELKEAWGNVYGRSPDPSDAWDHAIKAVEELLGPVVLPNATKPTLGTILDAMEAKPSKWTFGMDDGGQNDEIEALAKLLRLIWVNPDRHGGSRKRTPRQDEAERVVGIAVLVTNMCRGHLVTTP